MTTQPSHYMLIKISDGADPENFNIIGGLRQVELDISHDFPENNTLESGRWRSVAPAAGFSRVSISGEGLYTASHGESLLLSHVLAGTAENYQFHFSHGDVISGSFVITNYNRAGDTENEELFLISLINHGAISFISS